MSKKTTPILDGAYEVIGIKPGPVGYKRGTVNLEHISEKEAENLVKQGFPYLRKGASTPAKSKDK